MKIKNYSKLTYILIIISMFVASCMVNETSNKSSSNDDTSNVSEGPIEPEIMNYENLKIYGGSVYFRVEAPESVKRVEVIISSVDLEDSEKYNLQKNVDAWEGIIGNLSVDHEKEAHLNAYTANDRVVYKGKAFFHVVETNTVMVITKLYNRYSSRLPVKINSVTLNPYRIAPGETMNFDVFTESKNADDELTFQWTASKGTFDNVLSETPMWTAPDEAGTYYLTVTVKDSHSNIDFLTFKVQVDSNDIDSPLVPKGYSCYWHHKKPPCIKSIITNPKKFIQGGSVKLSLKLKRYYRCKLTYKWWTSCFHGNNCDNNYGTFNDSASKSPIFKVNADAPVEKFKLNVKVCNIYRCSYATKKVRIYESTGGELQITNITASPMSIQPGESTQLDLSVKSDCQEKIDDKCPPACTLEYSWVSSCPGSFNDSNIQDPIFTAAPGITNESCTLTALVSDQTSQVSGSVVITINQENSAPVINSLIVDKDEVDKNEIINATVNAVDPDGDSLNYLWSSTCSGSFNDTTSKDAIFTVSSNPIYGYCSISVKVDDGQDNDVESKTILIKKVNGLPIINKLYANQGTLDQGESTGLEVQASDPDGDALSYLWTTTCDGTFDNANITTPNFIVNTNAQYGICTIDIEVSDGTDKVSKSLTIKITETEVNTPPEIVSMFVDPKQAFPGESVSISVDAFDIDGDVLTYDWSSTCSGNFDNSQASHPIFTIADDVAQYGNCLFKVVIGDGESDTYGFLAFEILKDNTAPVINNLTANPSSLDQGEVTNLELDVTDADGDTLTYWWTTNCEGTFNDPAIEDPEFTVSSTASYGECMIYVEVSDGTDTVKDAIKIDISEPITNEAPIIVSSFQTTDSIMTGDTIVFIVRASDPEGTALSFTWSSTDGTFSEPIEDITQDYTESFVVWTAPDCGIYPIYVKVNIMDADGVVTEKMFLPVTLIDGVACP